MRVLTPVVPTRVVATAARIDSRLDGIGGGGADCQSVDGSARWLVGDTTRVLRDSRRKGVDQRGDAGIQQSQVQGFADAVEG